MSDLSPKPFGDLISGTDGVWNDRRRVSVHRGTRCGLCYWALYDGDWCQNPACAMYSKSQPDKICLSNEEAVVLIKWKHANDKLTDAGTKKL